MSTSPSLERHLIMKRILRGFFFYLLFFAFLMDGRDENSDDFSGRAVFLGVARSFATIGAFIGLGMVIGTLIYLFVHPNHPNAQLAGFLGWGGALGFFGWDLSLVAVMTVARGFPLNLRWPERLFAWAFARNNHPA